MGRFARIVLVVVALALVFAPRTSAAVAHDGPRLLTAAVLAPTTGDGDAITPARERDAAPTLVTIAVLVADVGLVLPSSRRHHVAAEPHRALAGAADPLPRRRGPPRSFA
jgi:hypothetical protein